MPALDPGEVDSWDRQPWPPRTPAEESPPPKASVLRRQDGVATPNFSPPASLSMDLPPLNMSPYASDRSQEQEPPLPALMTPSSPPLPSGNGGDQDPDRSVAPGGSNRDALVRRLNGLAEKLNREEHRDDGDERLGTLNAIVDQMESVFSDHIHPGEGADTPKQTGLHTANGGTSDVLKKPQMPGRSISDWLGPLSPFELSALPVNLGGVVRAPPQHDSHNDDGHGRKMTHVESESVAAEAQKLCRELDAVMASLKARQEESEHIHDLLITRAERAAQHIVYQEKRIQELEKERDENEMEILNLQFQLKAIEVQFLGHGPGDGGARDAADGSALADDQELRESISAWKSEWSALKRRRARKKQRDLLAAEASSASASAAVSPTAARIPAPDAAPVVSSGSPPVQKRIRSHNQNHVHSRNYNHKHNHNHIHNHDHAIPAGSSSPVIPGGRSPKTPGIAGRPAVMTASDSRPG